MTHLLTHLLISLHEISAGQSKTAVRPLLVKLEVITLTSSCSFIARTIHTLEEVIQWNLYNADTL